MNNIIIPSTKLRSMSGSKMKACICDRYYYWLWVMNLTPRNLNKPFWFGSVMHAGFEAMLLTKILKKIYKAMDKASAEEISKYALVSEDNAEIQLQLKIAKLIIKVYLEECKSDLTYLSEVHTEIPFAFELEESPVIYEGTVDAYGTHKTKTVLVERKTAKTINDDFFALLKFDIQINGYAHSLTKSIGHLPSECKYVAFRKPQKRVKKKQTPAAFLEELEQDFHDRKDWYYVTYTHKFGQNSVAEVVTDIERTVSELYHKYQTLSTKQLLDPAYWPRKQSQCLHYGACPYLILCKNCRKAPLYFRLFQQRELRYPTEYKELADTRDMKYLPRIEAAFSGTKTKRTKLKRKRI